MVDVMVSGRFTTADNVASAGTVTFTPAVTLVKDDGDDTVIVGKTIVRTLNSIGEFTALLQASDDPDLNPTGWTYQVVESLIGVPRRTYSIVVPTSAAPLGIDLMDVSPAEPSVGVVPGPVTSVAGRVGAVVLSQSDIAGLVEDLNVLEELASTALQPGWEPEFDTWTRATSAVTTGSLVSGGVSSIATIELALGYRLYSISTSRPARVRLYSSAAARSNDVSRVVGVDPGPNAGVILDYITTDDEVYALSPLVDGASMETTPVVTTPVTVTNNDVVTGTVTVTCTWIRTE